MAADNARFRLFGCGECLRGAEDDRPAAAKSPLFSKTIARPMREHRTAEITLAGAGVAGNPATNAPVTLITGADLALEDWRWGFVYPGAMVGEVEPARATDAASRNPTPETREAQLRVSSGSTKEQGPVNTLTRWSRILGVVGTAGMLIGAIDPLEGSVVILPGIGLLLLGAFMGKSRYRSLLFWAFILAAVGVGAMFVMSAFGGIGGNTGRSMWWGLVIAPYPVGWIMAVVGAVRWLIESFRHRANASPVSSQAVHSDKQEGYV